MKKPPAQLQLRFILEALGMVVEMYQLIAINNHFSKIRWEYRIGLLKTCLSELEDILVLA